MLWGGSDGGLELRRSGDGSTHLRGTFPYDRYAVLSDGGRTGKPRKEVLAPRAFEYRVNTPSDHGGKKEIHLLAGHDFNHPLASVRSGTLNLRDTAAALIFEAIITPAIASTVHGRDALAMIGAGLAVGISPGFRIPPQRAVPVAEEIEQEPDDGTIDEQGQPRRGAIIRRILSALLYELSIVTRPAYPEAQVEARNWSPGVAGSATPPLKSQHPLNRWRL